MLVEVPNPGHPFGVRGVGEVPIVPPLGAIANAIHDAIGIRMRTLPATPRVLLEAAHGPQRPRLNLVTDTSRCPLPPTHGRSSGHLGVRTSMPPRSQAAFTRRASGAPPPSA